MSTLKSVLLLFFCHYCYRVRSFITLNSIDSDIFNSHDKWFYINHLLQYEHHSCSDIFNFERRHNLHVGAVYCPAVECKLIINNSAWDKEGPPQLTLTTLTLLLIINWWCSTVSDLYKSMMPRGSSIVQHELDIKKNGNCFMAYMTPRNSFHQFCVSLTWAKTRNKSTCCDNNTSSW